VQLVSPHVYRDNMVRAALKKNFGKTPRRSTQVHSERAVNAEVPLLEGCKQLMGASTDVIPGTSDLDDTVLIDTQGWLCPNHSVNRHVPRINAPFGLCPCLDEPPGNQGLVQALVRH
jgi:hypothetical protein